MSEFNIEVQGGSSVRLNTAGKYCDRDIIVTASGGGEDDKWKNLIQESLYNLPSNEAHTIFKRTSVKDVSSFDFSKVGTFNYMFLYCADIEKISLDMSNGTSADSFCKSCESVKTVKLSNTGKCANFSMAFSGCINLISLETLDCSSIKAFRDLVLNCNKLVTLKFKAETIKASIHIPSPVLSAESVQSIVDGLAYITTSQNLILNSSVVVTDNQKQVVRDKGWTLIMN